MVKAKGSWVTLDTPAPKIRALPPLPPPLNHLHPEVDVGLPASKICMHSRTFFFLCEQTFLTTFHIHINSEFFGFNFNPDSDSPFLYPFHRAHAQCSLGIHHGVQRIELHRYVLCCCLSLFSNEYFRGIEMKLVLISEISSSFIYSVPENNIMHLVVQVRPT